jgi:tetratricopeptide (TPR) repeat protein
LIVAKAMNRDRDLRYASATDLAADLQRFLQNEPIVARAPELVYRARKFVQRHKPLVIGLSAAALALIAGVITTSIQAHRAQLAEQRERQEASRATMAARDAQAINQFLRQMLLASDPNVAQGREWSVRDVLESAAARIETELSSEPVLKAEIHDTIGQTYRNMGEYTLAEPHLRTALELRRTSLGNEHADVAASLHQYATCLMFQGDAPNATPLAQESLDIRQRLRGTEHEEVAASLNLVGELARINGDLETAEASFLESWSMLQRLGHRDRQAAAAASNLGRTLCALYRYADAEPFLMDALKLARTLYDKNHPFVIGAANNLAMLYVDSNRFAEAEPLLREVLDRARHVFGEEHPNTARLENTLADTLHTTGDHAAAEPLVRHALATRRKTWPDGHPGTAESLVLLADILADQGDATKMPEAIACIDEAIPMWEKAGQGGYWSTSYAEGVRGACLTVLKQYDEAEQKLRGALDDLMRAKGPRHRRTRAVAEHLASLYEAWGRPQDAEAVRSGE